METGYMGLIGVAVGGLALFKYFTSSSPKISQSELKVSTVVKSSSHEEAKKNSLSLGSVNIPSSFLPVSACSLLAQKAKKVGEETKTPLPLSLLSTMDDLPEEYLCPITQEVMKDPVQVADGRSYERKAIQKWYNQGHRTCPCNPDAVLVNPATLKTDRLLKALIKRCLSQERIKKVDSDLLPTSQ